MQFKYFYRLTALVLKHVWVGQGWAIYSQFLLMDMCHVGKRRCNTWRETDKERSLNVLQDLCLVHEYYTYCGVAGVISQKKKTQCPLLVSVW